MPHWRLVVHALDRTGPPMLALAFLRWARRNRPTHSFDLIAHRGGELVHEATRLAPTRILLDPDEPWDPVAVSERRLKELSERVVGLAVADATLLVSVAAGQALPFLDGTGPVLTYVVEQGTDLHWLDAPVGLLDRTARWLAGSEGTRRALQDRLPDGTSVSVCTEFVEVPPQVDPDHLAHCRSALGARGGDLLVLGAGIGTARKGVDLFLEVAAAAARRGLDDLRFAWLGGERDDLHWRVREETERLRITTLRWFGSVPAVEPWLAAADVLLHPARLDAFPLICLHAGAVGTPVLAFRNAGGVEEMFGEAFLGVQYPDIEGLVDQIEELREPEARAAAGRAQQEVVLARCTSEIAAPRLIEQLEAARRGAALGSGSSR